MLTKQQFLDSCLKEIKIIKHLYEKVTPDMLEYRPTEKQRSTRELLQYLANVYEIEARAIAEGTALKNFHETMQNAYRMPMEKFLSRLDEQAAVLQTIFSGLTDEQMAEEVDLFGAGRSQARVFWFTDLILKSLAAYKMQLFLYLKANGVTDIGTSNLWRGEDAKK